MARTNKQIKRQCKRRREPDRNILLSPLSKHYDEQKFKDVQTLTVVTLLLHWKKCRFLHLFFFYKVKWSDKEVRNKTCHSNLGKPNLTNAVSWISPGRLNSSEMMTPICGVQYRWVLPYDPIFRLDFSYLDSVVLSKSWGFEVAVIRVIVLRQQHRRRLHSDARCSGYLSPAELYTEMCAREGL